MKISDGTVQDILLQQMDYRYEEAAHLSDDLTDDLLQQFLEANPMQRMTTGHERRLGYVDISPKRDGNFKDIDPSVALVLPQDLTHGWDANVARQTLILRGMLDPIRTVVFPNNTGANDTAYNLTTPELEEVASGNLSDLAERQLSTLRQLGVNRVHYVGYHLGAILSIEALKRVAYQPDQPGLEVGNSLLLEPAVPARQAANSDRRLAEALASPTNQALLQGVNTGFYRTSLNDLSRHMKHYDAPGTLTIARAGLSNCLSAKLLDEWARVYDENICLNVPGCTSEQLYEKPLVYAALARMAIAIDV
jgi:hypothetical protein